jgi:hypothetical protein
VVVENHSAAAPGDYITLDDLAAVLGLPSDAPYD